MGGKAADENEKRETTDIQTQPVPKQKVSWKSRILIGILLAVGYTMLIFPMLIDQIARLGQTATIAAMDSDMNSMTEEELRQAWALARLYNANLAEYRKKEPFHYLGAGATDDTYEALPTKNDEMCVLEVPDADILLPVGHGTSDDTLTSEAGHIYGTSLPVGGSDTHTVIAAHTALRNAELFTRLTDMQEGDIFYIHVLDEVHAYKVSNITVCLPEEADSYLQIQDGEDLCTLFTCTPYGINTHRLIVTAERTENPDMVGEDGAEDTRLADLKIILKIILLCLPYLMDVLYVTAPKWLPKLQERYRKKKEKKKIQKSENA